MYEEAAFSAGYESTGKKRRFILRYFVRLLELWSYPLAKTQSKLYHLISMAQAQEL